MDISDAGLLAINLFLKVVGVGGEEAEAISGGLGEIWRRLSIGDI